MNNLIAGVAGFSQKSVTRNRQIRFAPLSFLLAFFLAVPFLSFGQDTTAVRTDSTATLRNDMVAGDESESETPRRQLIKFNEYKGPYFTARQGGGYLHDYAAYWQDNDSKEQIDLENGFIMRDFRFVLKGRLGPDKMKHPITYSVGYMYDKPNKKWLFRETGLMFGVPELWGKFFIGRTKEGFSLNKVMVGYAGWTHERSTMSDATVPILGDGIKWLGFVPGPNIGWNAGYFFDKFNEDQAFSSYDHQVVTRLMWLPILSEKEKKLLHIGVNLRQGTVDKDTLQIRSRPESFQAPYIVDSKKMHATQTFMYGGEIYYRAGPWLFGSEYWFQDVDSPENGNPVFHGGDVVATWLITGETRQYNTMGGFFHGISPKKTIFQGGIGAIEAVFRVSYIDLNDAKIKGGQFWRITPMVNWHMSDNIRLEFVYGYSELDRFGLIGGAQFLQSRIQFQL